MTRSTLAPLGVVLGLALGSALLVTTPAAAEAASSIEFVGGPVTAEFGSDWSAQLSLAINDATGGYIMPMPLAAGTVDVALSGVEGTWAAGLPVQADGSVYVSQPLGKPLIPAGTYTLSASFIPAADSGLFPSTTPSALALTITAIPVTAKAEVSFDADTSERTVTASLAGDYVQSHGSPAGTWSVLVEDGKDAEVYRTEAAVAMGAKDASSIVIDATLEPGGTYTVTTTFTPVDELAGGVEVAQPSPAEFTEGGGNLLAVPVWAVITAGAVLLGLAAAAVILAVRGRRRMGAETAPTTEENHEPSDPAVLDS